MAQVGNNNVGNNQDNQGGEFMIQDHDHMVESNQSKSKAKHGNARQSEQSQSGGRQQGSGDHRGNTGRRQAH